MASVMKASQASFTTLVGYYPMVEQAIMHSGLDNHVGYVANIGGSTSRGLIVNLADEPARNLVMSMTELTFPDLGHCDRVYLTITDGQQLVTRRICTTGDAHTAYRYKDLRGSTLPSEYTMLDRFTSQGTLWRKLFIDKVHGTAVDLALVPHRSLEGTMGEPSAVLRVEMGERTRYSEYSMTIIGGQIDDVNSVCQERLDAVISLRSTPINDVEKRPMVGGFAGYITQIDQKTTDTRTIEFAYTFYAQPKITEASFEEYFLNKS